jgi:hypothetical protein
LSRAVRESVSAAVRDRWCVSALVSPERAVAAA